MKPRPERLLRSKPVQRAVGMKKPFLHRVLRILVRHDDRPRDRVGSPLIRPHQQTKRVAVASLRGENVATLPARLDGISEAL